MIVYHDILGKLSAAGYPSTRIQREKLIPNSTLNRIRHGTPISTATLDTICRLLSCQPSDLITYEKDPED